MNSFNQKKTIEDLQKYLESADYFEKPEKENQKDFYNLFDGTVTRGKCGKKMKLFKSLFHLLCKK